MWRQHDRILASNWEIAREIYSHVITMDQRLERQLQHSRNPASRANIEEQRKRLHTYIALSARTWELYEWTRNEEGKASRPGHPWDTEPAAQSKYAEALGLAATEQPISPMRGVLNLQATLLAAYEEGAGFSFRTYPSGNDMPC
jgi:hypothetical protein